VWPAGTVGRWQVQAAARAGAAGRYELTVRAYRGVLRAGPTERDQLDQQAQQLNAREAELYRAGRYAEAAALRRRELALRQQLYPAAQYPQGHPALALSLNNLGFLLHSAGQYEAAR